MVGAPGRTLREYTVRVQVYAGSSPRNLAGAEATHRDQARAGNAAAKRCHCRIGCNSPSNVGVNSDAGR